MTVLTKNYLVLIEDIQILNNNRGIKKACKKIDTLISYDKGWDEFSLIHVARELFKQENDFKMDEQLTSLFFYSIRKYLKDNRFTADSRFRNFLINEALCHYFDDGNAPINISDKLKENCQCSCGCIPKIIISDLCFHEIGVIIQCPCCGITAKQRMVVGNALYGGNHYLSIKKMVRKCIKAWNEECKKPLEYIALELLVSEFYGRIDVTDVVRIYSQNLKRYCEGQQVSTEYEDQVSTIELLYHDRYAMRIVAEFMEAQQD